MAYEYKYRKRSAEQWDKRAKQSGSDFEGIILDEYPTYTIKSGENWVRFLPPSKEWEASPDFPDHFGMDVWTHRNVNRATVICLQKMKGKRCPVCEEHNRALAAGDQDLAKELRAQKRVVCWVFDRKEPDRGAQVWAMPFTIDRDVSKIVRDRGTGEIFSVDDPKGGYDVYFDKIGEGIGTKYSGFQLAQRPSQVPSSAVRKADETPVPEVLKWRSYDEIASLLAGGTDKDEDEERPPRGRFPQDEDDDYDRPTTRRSRNAEPDEDDDPPPRRNSRRADPDEDDDPPPRRNARRSEPEDEDEDPPPRRSSRRSEPDEDEDPPPRRRSREPDEDEDPPPRRTRRSEPEDDEDPPPRRRSTRAEPDEDEDPPPRRRAAREPEPEEDEDPPPRRRAKEPEPDEDEDEDDGARKQVRANVASRAKALREQYAKDRR